MSMFCFQCQETARNTGCTVQGVCGKKENTAKLMDALIYTLRGMGLVVEKGGIKGDDLLEPGLFAIQSLFMTITNANFDESRLMAQLKKAFELRDSLKKKFNVSGIAHDSATWSADSVEAAVKKAETVGVLSTENEDVRSLREMLIYGVKGISAYADHAAMLGYEKSEIYAFVLEALASTTKELTVDQMVGLALKAGSFAVEAMALLDKANTETYGNPEITEVNLAPRDNPGILISGHDLHDMKDLLEQTKDAGVDVYTHSEMLPANYYPAFKKYKNLVGNYGSSWWHQNSDFEKFNGPILMTTNCIIPVKDSYKDRIFTTGMAGYPGVEHLADREKGKAKDFSKIIALAKKCKAPEKLEDGKIIGGFAHNQVLALADKVVEAVKSGAIKRFVVMAGCDGRHKEREYFTKVAEALPKDHVILTAGCAKYRYNKLPLGDIGGIPRVLDAGQCNDSYSLAVIALKLKEVFGLKDVNDLPLSFDIGWYEQKAVAVLLALLHLGFKNIRLGPTLPGFLSPNVAKVLVENFNISRVTTPEADVAAIASGK